MSEQQTATVETAGDKSGCASVNGSASSRDWVEDAPHENGNYQCRCVQCHKTFVGHKRRVVCKICDGDSKQNTKYKTAHELARELLAGPDLMAVIAVPTYDMPGCSTARPVKATQIKVEDKDCIVISAACDAELPGSATGRITKTL